MSIDSRQHTNVGAETHTPVLFELSGAHDGQVAKGTLVDTSGLGHVALWIDVADGSVKVFDTAELAPDQQSPMRDPAVRELLGSLVRRVRYPDGDIVFADLEEQQ